MRYLIEGFLYGEGVAFERIRLTSITAGPTNRRTRRLSQSPPRPTNKSYVATDVDIAYTVMAPETASDTTSIDTALSGSGFGTYMNSNILKGYTFSRNIGVWSWWDSSGLLPATDPTATFVSNAKTTGPGGSSGLA